MNLTLPDAELRSLVAQVVQETLAQVADRGGDGRLGLTEAEAAAALGIEQHRLRDSRLRGEVHARKIGKRYVYSASRLRRWLEGNDD